MPLHYYLPHKRWFMFLENNISCLHPTWIRWNIFLSNTSELKIICQLCQSQRSYLCVVVSQRSYLCVVVSGIWSLLMRTEPVLRPETLVTGLLRLRCLRGQVTLEDHEQVISANIIQKHKTSIHIRKCVLPSNHSLKLTLKASRSKSWWSKKWRISIWI